MNFCLVHFSGWPNSTRQTLTPAQVVASGRAIADVIGDAFCPVGACRQMTFADLPPAFDDVLARDARTMALYRLRERFTGDRARDAATLAANNARKRKPK